MSSKTILDLAAFFPNKSPTQYAVSDYGDRFSGFYIGENIVLTAAHTLHDVRWSLDPQGSPTGWTLVNAVSSGVYKSNTSVVTPWTFHVNPGFYAFVNSNFGANQNPYANSAIASHDTAWATSTTSVATRDLIGAGVFYGAAVANSAAIGTTVTLEYRLNGTYGTISGGLSALGNDTASAGMSVVAGMSGGAWESSFRTVRTSDSYAFGVQSNAANGATAALISPILFDAIMAQLAVGKTGAQSAQPANYLHGSDNADGFQGSFRPDVIYGNDGAEPLMMAT